MGELAVTSTAAVEPVTLPVVSPIRPPSLTEATELVAVPVAELPLTAPALVPARPPTAVPAPVKVTTALLLLIAAVPAVPTMPPTAALLPALIATGLPTEPTELLLMMPVAAAPTSPPTVPVVVLTGTLLRTFSRVKLLAVSPTTAPVTPVFTTLPPLRVKLRRSATKVEAKRPPRRTVRLIVRLEIVWPRPSKRPLNELVTLAPLAVSSPMGLKLAIDDRSMLLPSA